MIAAVLYGKKDIRIEQVECPAVGEDQVLIAVRAVGICGSDIHYYQEFGMGENYRITKPQILGHEASGVIVKVGKGVDPLWIGQRVAIEPGETCGHCTQCKTGHYNLCKDVRFLSVPGNKGAFAEYLVMHKEMVFPIPDDMSFEVACMAEPLSVGIHACKMMGIGPGTRLMITGAGPIGLMTAAAARAFGVKDITIGDIQEERLIFAKKYCNVKNAVNMSDITVEEIKRRYTEDEGFDCLIETSGAEACQHSSVKLVRKGGGIGLVGIPKEEVSMDIFNIIDKEITLRGIFRYANTYPAAIEILHNSDVDFQALVTHRFPLERTGEALNFALNNKTTAIKTVVVNGGEGNESYCSE